MRQLYILMTLISTLVRQFALPNPFECFGNSAELINWIAEPIIHAIAYGIVGLFYVRGSNPLVGSLAYLATYAFVIFVLWVFGIFSFAWWWILIITIATIALIAGVAYLKSKLDNCL